MRIAIFTDVHGNKEALKAIFDDIKKENIDETICLGDTIGIGPNPRECMDLIVNNNVTYILGNHELYYLIGTQLNDEMDEAGIRHCNWVASQLTKKHQDYLKNCPLTIERTYNGKKILFTHFLLNENSKDLYPYHEFDIIHDGTINEIVKKLDYDYIFTGHEHEAFTVDDKLFDIGSSGCLTSNITKYTIFNTDTFKIETKKIKYDRIGFENSMKERDYPERNRIAPNFYSISL